MASNIIENAGGIAVGVLAMAIVSGISFLIGSMGQNFTRHAVETVETMSIASVESTVINLNSNSKSIPASHLYMIISMSGGQLDIIRSVSEDQFLNNTSYDLKNYNMTPKAGEPSYNLTANAKSPVKDLDILDKGAYPLFQTTIPPRNPDPPIGNGLQRPQETYVVRVMTFTTTGGITKYKYATDSYGNPRFEASPRSSVRIRDKDDLIPIFHKQLRVRVIQLESTGDQTGSGEDDQGKFVVLVTEG